jgi:hypothetical protein
VVKKVKAQSRHNVGTTSAQKRHKKDTKQAQTFFRKKGQNFCAKFRHKTAQKGHKNCTKCAQNMHKIKRRTHKSTKQASCVGPIAGGIFIITYAQVCGSSRLDKQTEHIRSLHTSHDKTNPSQKYSIVVMP